MIWTVILIFATSSYAQMMNEQQSLYGQTPPMGTIGPMPVPSNGGVIPQTQSSMPIDFSNINRSRTQERPANIPQRNSGKLNSEISFLTNRPGQCAFEPLLSADDASLLENTQKTIKVLRDNDKCRALAPQMQAFEEAMEEYNKHLGLDRPSGYDGQININCSNYESIYDLEFDYFVNTWDGPPSGFQDPFMSCRGMPQQDAIDCGALVTGSSKAKKKNDCEKSQSSIKSAQGHKTLAQSYKTSIEMLQAIISNDGCIDSTGDQKLSFIQSAVGLAGRAASIDQAGTSNGLLINAATDLVGTLVDKMFRSYQRSKDNLLILENRSNFTKIACLYEQLESKALRCDRISANREVEASKKQVEDAKNCVVAQMQNEEALQNTVNSLGGVIISLNSVKTGEASSTVPSSDFDINVFDEIVQKLNAPYPGGEESVLNISEMSSKEVATKLNEIVSSDENLKTYIVATSDIKKPNNSDLRQFRSKFLSTVRKAEAINRIFKVFRDADVKGTDISSNDIQLVEKELKDFGGKESFISIYNEVMIARSTLFPNDDMANRIRNYNLKIGQVDTFKSLIKRYDNKVIQSESDFQDNGNFSDAAAGIRPHLKLLMEQELDLLLTRAKNLKDIQPGAPAVALKEQMRTKEEEVLYPILRACNQLRSVMNIDSGEYTTKQEHSACKAFNCDKGSLKFSDYLNQNQLPGDDSNKCKNNSCQAQYARYICQERTKLSNVRNNLKNEFLDKGTICGRSMSKAFGN